MGDKQNLKRRTVLKQIALTGTALPIVNPVYLRNQEDNKANNQIRMKGNINHAVCKWCFDEIPLEEFAIKVKSMGITGIDLIGPEGWPILKNTS